MAQQTPFAVREQGFQMALPAEQIVDLHEVESGHAPKAPRLGHLFGPVALQPGPNLGGGEESVRPGHPGEAIADDLLRRAVHGRGIDHPPAVREEGRQDLRPFVAQGLVRADIEGDPAAHADHGQLLAGHRHGAGQHVGGRGDGGPEENAGQARQDGGRPHALEQIAPSERFVRHDRFRHGFVIHPMTIARSGGAPSPDCPFGAGCPRIGLSRGPACGPIGTGGRL